MNSLQRMGQFDSSKDYYNILGADEAASRRDIERLYKRLAARHHPDRGGDEEDMKSLNEAYRILRDETMRRDYDSRRRQPSPPEAEVTPVAAPTASDVGSFGQGLSAFLCLLVGLFLLLLVRAQWIWFLWPLAILAVLVIGFGVLMARSAVRIFGESLSRSNPIRRHKLLQEAVFWILVCGSGYGLYLLLTVD
jgi:DnaJ domain